MNKFTRLDGYHITEEQAAELKPHPFLVADIYDGRDTFEDWINNFVFTEAELTLAEEILKLHPDAFAEK